MTARSAAPPFAHLTSLLSPCRRQMSYKFLNTVSGAALPWHCKRRAVPRTLPGRA